MSTTGLSLATANALEGTARALCAVARRSVVDAVKIHGALDNIHRAVHGGIVPIRAFVTCTSPRMILEGADALRQEVIAMNKPSARGRARALALEFAGEMYRVAGEILQGEFAGRTLSDEDIPKADMIGVAP